MADYASARDHLNRCVCCSWKCGFLAGNGCDRAVQFCGLPVLPDLRFYPLHTYSGWARDDHADSTRYSAATALLDRGYGRPAQSLDLHLLADAITKRLSDMTDAELAALEQRSRK